ncbi:uncharacterized protein LOC111710287 isoform X2 [Eurytemora carolleeae]|uniref:uncharacterized protein LOC111710287 isoform X2 n=1 Tax=Eurytemora carolleeae TaxID=1294199 RepID=UPI000C77F92D|nr:uncharacterized protein LOC111710287 isoform X2 [Eurytemora carolleeae]|eukprot:XP_023340106.1 uncharacterized protein LOC111710287 isoform X2 [Eurytemora affinis]
MCREYAPVKETGNPGSPGTLIHRAVNHILRMRYLDLLVLLFCVLLLVYYVEARDTDGDGILDADDDDDDNDGIPDAEDPDDDNDGILDEDDADWGNDEL